MKKTILITGSNGGVAQQLSLLLQDIYSLRFLTRKKTRENEYEWNIEKQLIDVSALDNVNHIIHLAGADIANQRWSENRKKIILSSRIDSAKLLLKTLKEKKHTIDSFISASATGYYGSITSDKIYTESDKKGNDFLSDVCYQWESAADEFRTQNIAGKVVKIRTGIVLSKNKNGVLEKMKKPIENYLGACLGTGKQYIPWIHIEDLCSIFKYAIENHSLQGSYNAVAPQYTTNKDLTYAIAQNIHKPIFLPNVPGFMIRILFGEVSGLLLEGSRVSSEKIRNTGFTFEHTEIKKALNSLL